jgi:hypothetical protein
MGKWTSDGSEYIDYNVQLMGSNVPLAQAVPMRITNGTNEPIITLSSVDGSNASYNSLMVQNRNYAYNESTFDRVRNNTQGTLLASQARTIQTGSPIQTNYNAKGVILFLNVTVASGTGGLQPKVLIVDPVSGNAIQYYADPGAITGTGLYAYVIYPGDNTPAYGTTKQHVQTALPRTWQANVYVGDASSYTYSLGYALIL